MENRSAICCLRGLQDDLHTLKGSSAKDAHAAVI